VGSADPAVLSQARFRLRYRGVEQRPDGLIDYYVCSGRCGSRKIRSDLVAGLVEERLLFEIGDIERRERVYVPGADHSEALGAVLEAIKAARHEKDLGLYDGDDDGYFSRLQRLTERRRELEALAPIGGGMALGEPGRDLRPGLGADGRRRAAGDAGGLRCPVHGGSRSR
jgi:hypothetical protein